MQTSEVDSSADGGSDKTFSTDSVNSNADSDRDIDSGEQDLSKTIELKLGPLLLKLEYCFHVPRIAIDELLQELHYLIGSASVPISNKVILETFRNHNISID